MRSLMAEIDCWIFDLDNTLYPRHCDLFSQIDLKMTAFVSNLTGLEPVEARKLQKDLYRDFGTTLRGLMARHDVKPHDFLDVVHDIDYSPLPSMPELGAMIEELPGRKFIYTNGSVAHAENTLDAMDIHHGLFSGIFDIVASDFEPKPDASAFDRFVAEFSIDGSRAMMFEDLPRNLVPAKAAGMKTVLVTPISGVEFKGEAWEQPEDYSDHVDHSTDDLTGFLGSIVGKGAA